ncbi:glycosyltransferase involved in cell wall biosynthesis [Winogradskyella epiphytica]|uniref:Glycosyltransferase involved in cell wall biosynthesis n=1 Tax=Winogradskyella epiphytica TaxID=262005 RepID=A0A2V4XTK5_9FLAO|nr:glycosyltransferase family 4 protein [Winogradskyella epiphytica]PYE81701.1 glycosyltransferase involved in cell wall biosynthesis [Winogradskyella epiphytica]GGW63285.1 glycosyl transferase [Winogradskyella epiphytica]
MKLDFVISSLGGGGAERVLALMVNSLAKDKKYQIRVITFFDREGEYQLNPRVKRVKLKPSSVIPSHTLRSIIGLSRYYKTKSNRPDIIISFVTLTNLITIVVAKMFKIKIIAQEHNSYLRFMEGRERITNFTKKHIYKRADVLTVLTSFDIEFYKNYGVNVKVLPNPCSFHAISVNNHEREKTILAAGNLNRYHHKGFDNLIKLIAPVLLAYPNWRLKIAGSGNEGLQYLKILAQENKILDRVIFTGFIDNIAEVMYKSSIFILASRYEGLPMVLLEAMSQGMACISFDCKTGPSDIIDNDINGLLIEDQNMLEMRKGLDKLINDNELRKKLSDNGIKSLNKYQISAITERYDAMFTELNRHHE